MNLHQKEALKQIEIVKLLQRTKGCLYYSLFILHDLFSEVSKSEIYSTEVNLVCLKFRIEMWAKNIKQDRNVKLKKNKRSHVHHKDTEII